MTKKKEMFGWDGKFTFVDVEIPNIKNNSVCAISLIVVENRQVRFRHTELINPRSFFSNVNISIHHITPQDVQKKRTFASFWRQYQGFFSPEYVIIGHNVLSDINVISRDLKRSGLFYNPGFYIDTMDLALEQFYHGNTQKGDLKLDHICENMQIAIEHHNPQSDVNACFEILNYLYQHGFRDLDSYIKEVHLKMKSSHMSGGIVRNVSMKKYLSDISTRNFKPYFAKFDKSELAYQPYFDQISFCDLKKVYIPSHSFEKSQAYLDEEKKIRDFIHSVGGVIIEGGKPDQANCVIEFSIPKPQEFLYYKKKGLKLFHSLNVLEYMKAYENQASQDETLWLNVLTNAKEAARDEELSSISMEEANRIGLEAYQSRDYARAVTYYELSVSRQTSNIRVYRHLADLYHQFGLYEQESRILKKGIRQARRRRVDASSLIRRLKRIEGKDEDV